jgi:hypothetical protein
MAICCEFVTRLTPSPSRLSVSPGPDGSGVPLKQQQHLINHDYTDGAIVELYDQFLAEIE